MRISKHSIKIIKKLLGQFGLLSIFDLAKLIIMARGLADIVERGLDDSEKDHAKKLATAVADMTHAYVDSFKGHLDLPLRSDEVVEGDDLDQIVNDMLGQHHSTLREDKPSLVTNWTRSPSGDGADHEDWRIADAEVRKDIICQNIEHSAPEDGQGAGVYATALPYDEGHGYIPNIGCHVSPTSGWDTEDRVEDFVEADLRGMAEEEKAKSEVSQKETTAKSRTLDSSTFALHGTVQKVKHGVTDKGRKWTLTVVNVNPWPKSVDGSLKEAVMTMGVDVKLWEELKVASPTNSGAQLSAREGDTVNFRAHPKKGATVHQESWVNKQGKTVVNKTPVIEMATV
jgi:hypothetical protein